MLYVGYIHALKLMMVICCFTTLNSNDMFTQPLLTPMTVAGVKRSSASVCDSVCLSAQLD